MTYFSGEAEAAFGLHYLLQDVALDASSAHVFVYHAMLQVDVINGQADQRQIRQGKSAQHAVCGSQLSIKNFTCIQK